MPKCIGCQNVCSNEFRLTSFWFEISDRRPFLRPQWSGIPLILWRVWKVIVGLYFLIWLGISLEHFHEEYPIVAEQVWLIYLTHWTYLFFISYLLLSAVNICLNSICHRKNAGLGIWSLKLQWLLWNIGAPATICVVLLYWSLLWPSRPEPRHPHPSIMNVHVHLVNGIIIFIEQAFHAMPMNWLHIYQPMAYASAYAIFTGIYYEANGTDPTGKPAIYPFLNYKTNQSFAIGADFAVILVVIPIIWTVLWSLHLFRDLIWRTCDPYATENFSLNVTSNDLLKTRDRELNVYAIQYDRKTEHL